MVENKMEDKMKDILNELNDGSKVLIVRDAVPVGKIGIDVILDSGENFCGALDINNHRELLKMIVMSIEEPDTDDDIDDTYYEDDPDHTDEWDNHLPDLKEVQE